MNEGRRRRCINDDDDGLAHTVSSKAELFASSLEPEDQEYLRREEDRTESSREFVFDLPPLTCSLSQLNPKQYWCGWHLSV